MVGLWLYGRPSFPNPIVGGMRVAEQSVALSQ
jgi:hypothetical protein